MGVLFFVSGVTGLVYEVVWTRYLTLVFGVSTVAATAVLVAFMAGQAVGSWVFGPIADRVRRPLWGYAALEAGIAVTGVLFPAGMGLVQKLYVSCHGIVEGSDVLIAGLRFALSLLLLLVPASLMGGTLPFLAAWTRARRGDAGRIVGWLYAANILGATLGCFASGFYLMGLLGMKGLSFVSAGLNLCVSGTSMFLGRGRAVTPDASSVAKPSDGPIQPRPSEAGPRWILLAWGLSGVGALALEILWMRMLIFFLWGSVYAFSAMLTSFLAGLGVGSLVWASVAKSVRRPVAIFGLIQALVGVTACLTVPILVSLFPSLTEVWSSFAQVVWGSPSYLKFLKSFIVMFPSTFLMGASFPLAVRCYARREGELGREVGRLYAANTFGCMLGAAFGTFVLLPAFGSHRAVLAASLLYASAALLSLRELRWRFKENWFIWAALACQCLLCLAIAPRQIILKSEGEDGQILYYKDEATATVKVWASPDGKERHLSINGYPVAGVAPDYADVQKMLAHLPCLLQKTGPQSVLIVGFGTGGTSYGVTLHHPEWTECAELVPGVPKAADFFPEVNFGVLRNPSYHLVIEDGRNRALTTRRKYDVITVDATSPKHAGNGSLYALEFYQSCKEKLTQDGVMAQWLPFHLLTEEEVRIILASMREVFPNTTVWLTRKRWYAIALGTHDPMSIDYQNLAARMSVPEIKREMDSLEIATVDDLLGCFVMGPPGLTSYCQGFPFNTDDRPIIEYYTETDEWGIFPFPARTDPVPVVNVPEDAKEKLSKDLLLSSILIRATYLFTHAQLPEAYAVLQQALQIDPNLPDAQSLKKEMDEYAQQSWGQRPSAQGP